MNSAMMMQSPHRDVLEAKPDSDASKAGLVEELQSRGRNAVGAKSWMDAKLLYEKALTVAPEHKMALLNSNLSLVHKNMGKMEEARQCAQAATEADSKYVKGWWRLGQALQGLHRSGEALEAFSKAKELEPQNKALIKEHDKVKKLVDEEAKLMKDTPMEEAPSTATSQPKTTTTTTATTTSKSTKPTTKMNTDDDDEKLFTKSEPVRGYKVVNGKKTSYFHNELTEEAKNLIGDIAPQKLETAPAPSAQASAAPGGVSAWNKAGTWEEKDVTKWAKESLEKQILQTTYVLPDSSPAPGALVSISKVSKVDGHASFALARGKKRYIYEFMAKIDWQMSGGKDDNDLECSGSLALPDIDGTIEMGEGYEIHDFSVNHVSDASLRPLIDRFIRRGGLHEALNESVDDWVRLFKNQY